MKIIAVHLEKGGVGKTTVSTSLAYELSTLGARTVLVDCDSQGNASSWLLEGRAEVKHEFADVLLGNTTIEKALVPVSDNLSVLATFGYSGKLSDYARSGLATEPFIIADTLEAVDADYVILDMGPGLGTLEQAALVATHEVVLCMTPEYFALDGISTWAAKVRRIERGMRVTIHYDKLVVNAYNDSVKQMQKVYAEAVNTLRNVYQIGSEPAFRKAQEHHIPVQLLKHGKDTRPMKKENRAALRSLAGDIHGVR